MWAGVVRSDSSAVAQRAKAEAIHLTTGKLDCFVASAPRNDGNKQLIRSTMGMGV
jgi:hypothetical protein